VGPWARAFQARCQAPDEPGTDSVTNLRFEPALITADVRGERVTLSAPPIPPGVWAALGDLPTTQSESFMNLLDHTWDEPLVPEEISRIGSRDAVAAVATAAAEAIDADPSLLLRWRGHDTVATTGEAWTGSALPELPPLARRPPDSVPKRLGATGIPVAGGDLMELLVTAYRAFRA
jgi:hypothetical protein